MYIPNHFTVTDKDILKKLVVENGFATLVCNDDVAGIPMVTHLPLQLNGDKLVGHMARPNPHWKMFNGKIKATAIFDGGHAYISPRWYISDGLVPTWNYVTTHVTGTARAIEDTDALRSIIDNLSQQYESSGPDAWRPSIIGEKKLEAMARGIIAFELTDLEWAGKFKLGQNKKPEDQRSVLSHHQAGSRDNDKALAYWMKLLED